jgi:hypothetical protein
VPHDAEAVRELVQPTQVIHDPPDATTDGSRA